MATSHEPLASHYQVFQETNVQTIYQYLVSGNFFFTSQTSELKVPHEIYSISTSDSKQSFELFGISHKRNVTPSRRQASITDGKFLLGRQTWKSTSEKLESFTWRYTRVI